MPALADTEALAETQPGPKPASLPPGSAPVSSDRWVGRRFDHFDVVSPIGRGGMGAVYLGHDRSLDRPVAIKVLPDEVAGQPDLQARFVREAQAQARLHSPHVVAIYFIGRTPPPEALYFAMEYVDGEALEAWLERKERVEPEQARRWMIDVVKGLRDAHRGGIIHRDVKPSNLLRDRNGYVMLVDFGLAKPLDGDKKITREGVILGSPLYMAPEQARGEEVDHRADMYSLGCTFYHLLTGSPAFDGPTPLAVVTKHVADPPPKLRDKAPGASAELSSIIDRLMSKDPGRRFATYDELLTALEAAAPEAKELAGFWTRGAALAVDSLMTLIMLVVLGALGPVWLAVPLQVLYITACHATTGQPLGKFLMRIRVVGPDGGPLGWQRSMIRTVASLWMPVFFGLVTLLTTGVHKLTGILTTLSATDLDEIKPLLLGIIMGNLLLVLAYLGGLAIALLPKKQALHDMISGSQVVYRLRRPTLNLPESMRLPEVMRRNPPRPPPA